MPYPLFAQNLKQIQEACLETCHYGVMHALLGGKAHYRDWHVMHGRTTVRPQDVQKQRKMEFAIAQRDKKGMYLLDATIKDRMGERGIEPSLWIVPPKLAMYFTMTGDWQTEYWHRGPQYEANLEKGPANMNPFRGTRVRECRKFDPDFLDKPHCPLTRTREIGSYWVLPQGSRYITIYDMCKDSWVTLDRVDLCFEGKVPADSFFVDLLIMRPFETYRMSSGILCKPGSDLGNTYTGNHDFMLSDNGTLRVFVGRTYAYQIPHTRCPILSLHSYFQNAHWPFHVLLQNGHPATGKLLHC